MRVANVDDRDCLFAAVAARLRAAVAATPRPLRDGAARALQAVVLECADDLDRLHGMSCEAFGGDSQPPALKGEAGGDRGAAPARP